ncbi:phosphatidate cytidylyltransferase, mitochondrial [Neodiprion pinetum]|uniref:Phosphatidate cytidylyltransferase, mitochondrial n=1 Tax=Neodiprion lecontei TaxID=441921 RepID=A0A6J0C646_NEOLC|nr:phosphatidate cytidylyltransferase, mitochondrial [Neodiprion lecontei]XP_046468666.1 phosphatidate cytidylyltransferase, mitochondrial [Neodiprion pinetum]
MNKATLVSQYAKILTEFPGNMKFCFAYGSGVMKQQSSDLSKNMLDLVFVVSDPSRWHKENMLLNPEHYAQLMRSLGPNSVAKIQEKWGAHIFYNTLVRSKEGRLIKYGVTSDTALIEDLLDWNVLYLAGRLHKPVQVLVKPEEEESPLRRALIQNLHSAVHATLILLPEHFTEPDFYKTIANLSYNGDFRMTFGEDKNKVHNIVLPQIQNFRSLYNPVLKHFDRYVEIPKSDEPAVMCHQDTSPFARIHHLNHLPRMPQVKLVRSWSQGPRSRDTEDCLRAIAHDPECSEILEACLKDIVWKSSVSQSLKGIFTVGIVKSVKYGAAKVVKMMRAQESSEKTTPEVNASLTRSTLEKKTPFKNEETKDSARRIQ